MISGFHNKWNRAVELCHPSIWIFIRHLKDEQRSTTQSVRAADAGETPEPRRRKWRQMEGRINRLKRQYRNGQRDLSQYWDGMVHVIRDYV